jgi:hypothetical protein
MHLMALALAHMTGEVTPDVAVMLLQESRKTILNLSVGHRPIGIDRVLSHLPPKVLTAESYRNLTDLLLVPATAKFWHHRTSITAQIITGLHTLPAALRTVAIMSMFSPVSRMVLFVDGLRFLAARTGLPFESLANQTHYRLLRSADSGGSMPSPRFVTSPRIGKTVWPIACSMLMKVHPQSICRTTGRLFVFYVAMAGWAGFWFRPRARKMRQLSRTSWPKFTQLSPMRASPNLRRLKPSRASLKPMSGHAIIQN